ncbi:hypothetical protein C8J56DRAFT_1046276 [Mycena floridula]|nr:hypothetical protein C8J56DRAFT_1046276 [Mycena floridula]
MLSFLIIAAVLGVVRVAGKTDPCAVAIASEWVSSAQAHACELNVPFNKTRSLAVVDSALKSLQYYSLENWFLASPNPLIPHNVNTVVSQPEAETKAGKFKTDWDFNSAVSDAYDREADGHSIFEAACTVAFSYNLPFSIATLAARPTDPVAVPTFLRLRAIEKVGIIQDKIRQGAIHQAQAQAPVNLVAPNLTSFGHFVTLDIYQLQEHPKVGVVLYTLSSSSLVMELTPTYTSMQPVSKRDDFGNSSTDVTAFTAPPFAGEDYLQKHGVRSAVFRGTPSAKVAQFDGGVKGSEVTDFDTILFELELAGLQDDPAAPQPFPIAVSLTYNYRNAIPYIYQQDGILEFVYEADTQKFQFTPEIFNRPQAVWEYTAEQFFGNL